MAKGWSPYVEITDFKHNRTYVGWIEDYSEFSEIKEVLLRDVIVEEQSTKTYLFTTPAIYIPLKEDFAIEFSDVPYHDKPNNPERSDINERQEPIPSTTAPQKKTAEPSANPISP